MLLWERMFLTLLVLFAFSACVFEVLQRAAFNLSRIILYHTLNIMDAKCSISCYDTKYSYKIRGVIICAIRDMGTFALDIRTPCLFISWLRKTVYSLSSCLSSSQLSSSDVPRSSLVDSHNFSLILPCILLLCVRASSLYHWSTPVLGISYVKFGLYH